MAFNPLIINSFTVISPNSPKGLFVSKVVVNFNSDTIVPL
jgi:hypothetical protein